MKTLKKIVIVVLVTLAIVGIAYAIDAYVLDRGEGDLVVPKVGIKGAVLEPTFVTIDGQPFLQVFVKKDASQVKADVAKRVAPTKGGDILTSYELEKIGSIEESKLAEEGEEVSGSGEELTIWGTILEVPDEDGQYLVTVEAVDQDGVSTKFKMFDYILSVQQEQEKIPGNTPGQSTVNKFLGLIAEGELEDAYELYSPAMKEKVSFEEFQAEFSNISEAEALEYNLHELSLAERFEEDSVKYFVIKNDERLEFDQKIKFRPNSEDPTEKWWIEEIE
ncbi:hypothetical protein ACFL2B_02260 [Patescibacteria group bacterium]